MRKACVICLAVVLALVAIQFSIWKFQQHQLLDRYASRFGVPPDSALAQLKAQGKDVTAAERDCDTSLPTARELRRCAEEVRRLSHQ